MVKINLNNSVGGNMSNLGGIPSDNIDRIVGLIHTGIEDINTIVNTIGTINSAIMSRKTTEIDNELRLRNAELDLQKEAYRHDEAMARINHDLEKLASETTDRDEKREIIKNQIQNFQNEYNTYLSYDKEIFLNETVTSRLDSLHRVITELIKELNHT